MIRRALLNTGWLMGARGVNAVLSLVYLALATRALGLDGFGNFILIVSFAQAIAGLLSFQTWQTVVRWGQQPDSARSAVGFCVALDMVSITVGSLAAAALLFGAGDWLPVPDTLRTEAFGLTVVCLLALRSTPTGILRLHDRYALGAAADSVTSIVRAIGAVLVFFLMPTTVGFVLVWAAAEVATVTAYWLMAWKVQPLDLKRISLRALPSAVAEANDHGPDRDASKGVWGFVFGTSLSGILLVTSRQVLVLLVGAFGGAAMAGIYRVAAQLGEGLLKLAQALLRATYPELVRDPTAARAIATRIALLALGTGVVVVTLSALFGGWAIRLIAGEQYLPAYWPMMALSAAAAVELSGATLEALLVAHGHALRNFLLRGVPTLAAMIALPLAIAEAGALGVGLLVLGASTLTVAGLVLGTRQPREV